MVPDVLSEPAAMLPDGKLSEGAPREAAGAADDKAGGLAWGRAGLLPNSLSFALASCRARRTYSASHKTLTGAAALIHQRCQHSEATAWLCWVAVDMNVAPAAHRDTNAVADMLAVCTLIRWAV